MYFFVIDLIFEIHRDHMLPRVIKTIKVEIRLVQTVLVLGTPGIVSNDMGVVGSTGGGVLLNFLTGRSNLGERRQSQQRLAC